MPLLPPPAPPATEIVVTGRGLAAVEGDAAYDVAVIDRARLTNTASNRLEDVLRDVAGFQQYRRSDASSAHPTSQGATLRGLGGNASSRALVVLDGVPQIDPFGGWVTFTALNPSRLGEVRVTRGGGSGVFGPGALAGTIELSSALPDQLAPIEAAAAGGSRGAVDSNASIAGRLGTGFATLSAAFQRGDGFTPVIARQRGPVDQPAGYLQGSVAARAAVPVGAAELQANMLLFRDQRNRGLDGTDNNTTGADASVRLVGRGAWGVEALGYLQLRKFDSGFASANATRTVVTRSVDQFNVPATGLGGRVELRPPLGRGIELRFGGDGRRTDGETQEYYSFAAGQPTRTRRAGGQTATAGLFADLTLPVTSTLVLTGGGRIDRWWITQGHLFERAIATGAPFTTARYADRHGWEPTGRGGIAWKPAAALRLRGAAYTGWRLPTLNELYRPYRVGLDAIAANAALSPERVRGVDGGIDWTPLPNVRLSVTGFHNELRDAIGNITIARGPGTFPGNTVVGAGGTYFQRGNLGAIRSNGAEFDGSVTDGRWRLSASYAFTDAHVRGEGLSAALDGRRPAQTPRHALSATIGREEASGLAAAATVRYVSRQSEDDQNSRYESAATTLDLVGAIPLGRRLFLTARVQNVTNELVEATVGADGTIERATPRTFLFGLRFRS